MSNPNVFNTIEVRTPERATFDLDHDVKLSANFGYLYPVLALDCLPGDYFNIRGNCMVRMAPMIAPIMHKVDVTIHYFFTPNRILWEDWEKFITGDNLAGPGAGPTPAHPYFLLNSTTYADNKFQDYLGLPAPGASVHSINAFPYAAYTKIYNDYYRDQNLIEEIPYKLVPGDNTTNLSLNFLRKRAYEHDYFTSALPFSQKGAAVDIPLGIITLNPDWDNGTPSSPKWRDTGMAAANELSTNVNRNVGPGNTQSWIQADDSSTIQRVAYDPDGSLVNTPVSINELRAAFRLQEWLEKNARGGTRYTESLLIHFNVKSSDARLQRAEYITGVKSPVIISEVLNTTGPTDASTAPQGEMAGHGISITDGHYGDYRCEEHGWIIGIMSILSKTAYQQGVPRMFSRLDRLDYAFPTFANLGEQAILNKELYAQHPDPDGTFGYTPRYSEYKFMNSRVAGDFKTNLNFWHLGRIFSTPPALNQQFIESGVEADYRIFAVGDDSVDHFYCHIYHELKASRPLPYYGTPMI